MSKTKPKFLVFDGNALVHRSFHALPTTMTTKDGEIVNAVYGFASFLLKAIKEFKPAFVAVTFDLAAPTFRHKQFADYKAKRVKAPDELYAQLDRVKEVVRAFNIPIYEASGFEADDCIGTITALAGNQVDTIIVTGDMDTLQLINSSTFVYTMSRGLSDSLLYDEKAVRERYGFGPEAQIDYKALRGDPSDNIPGVKGVGEKTATDLIKLFGSVDKLYQAIEKADAKLNDIKPRILDLLKTHKHEALLSKDLATIRINAPIKFKLDDCRFGNFDEEKIINLFSHLEFRSLLNRLKDLPVKDKTAKADGKFDRNQKNFDYKLVDNQKAFEEFLKLLKKQKAFAWDTETDSLDEINANLLGMSFCWQEGQAYFLKLRTKSATAKTSQGNLFTKNEDIKSKHHPWLKNLKPILENEQIKKYGHNLKFDIKVLASHDITIRGVEFDSMIAAYLLNPDNRQHNLDAVVFNELSFTKISKTDLLGEGRQKIDFTQVPTEKLSLYACEDADFAYRLVKVLSKKLKQEKLADLFNDLEMPLIEVLAKIELNGILIDPAYFKILDKKLDTELKKLQTKIWDSAGVNFNINSVQQLRTILFEKLKISTVGVGKTKTGLTTNAAALEKLKGEHKIIELLLDYRELNKLSTTYVKALPALINPTTGRVHTSFNQSVAATGRLSSTEPNLQNIPIKTDWGRQIRRGFVADKGKILASLDYSQIELRLAAHFSGDPTMIKAFQDGADIHLATASAINGVGLDKVTKEMRSAAKAINFGLLYGQGPHGLAQTAGLSYTEAKKFIDQYFKNFSHIKKYIDEALKQAREEGYVETILGRKRWLPEINSSVAMIAKAAERVAVNAPLQGSSADIIKLAMIKIDNLINKKFGDEIKLILQVHDELVFEMDKNLVKSVVPTLQEIMCSVVKLKVPLVVDAKIGDNWDEMKSL